MRRMTGVEIQNLVLALGRNIPWLDEDLAREFADKVPSLVGSNLVWLVGVAIAWMRNSTTSDQAKLYLDSLDEAKIAKLCIKCQDVASITLLTIFSLLDEGEKLVSSP